MITLISGNYRYPLKPTIFPDGTSQVWKLPEYVVRSSSVNVDWRFENEREIVDLLSLSKLLNNQLNTLHVPYLPYARQDKEVSNASTFNLEVFADLINSLKLSHVTSVDVHNPTKTENLIDNLVNIKVDDFHYEVVKATRPDYLVFPDAGAHDRYRGSIVDINLPSIVCDKTRDQLTGQITGHKIVHQDGSLTSAKRFLIVDDLCDGGATFISVARMLRDVNPDVKVYLCVTHGLFSKGRDTLLANGIDGVYTTDSLTKNEDGYKV